MNAVGAGAEAAANDTAPSGHAAKDVSKGAEEGSERGGEGGAAGKGQGRSKSGGGGQDPSPAPPCPVLLLQRLPGAVRYKEAMEAGAETEEEEGAVKAATVQQGLREQAPRHACV